MIGIQFKIDTTQMKAIDKLLKTLPKTLQSKILRSALADSSKPLKDAMKKNIPDFGNLQYFNLLDKKTNKKTKTKANSSTLKRSIGHVIKRGKRDGGLYAVVGPLFEKGGWFGHWVEYGTLSKRSKSLKRGRSDKANLASNKGLGLKKMPFIRPAIKQAGPQAIQVLRASIVEGITREIGKTLKKGKL